MWGWMTVTELVDALVRFKQWEADWNIKIYRNLSVEQNVSQALVNMFNYSLCVYVYIRE